jgi:hypothetical protein
MCASFCKASADQVSLARSTARTRERLTHRKTVPGMPWDLGTAAVDLLLGALK